MAEGQPEVGLIAVQSRGGRGIEQAADADRLVDGLREHTHVAFRHGLHDVPIEGVVEPVDAAILRFPRVLRRALMIRRQRDAAAQAGRNDDRERVTFTLGRSS